MRISIRTPSCTLPLECRSQSVKLPSPLALLEINLEKTESCDICEGNRIHTCTAGENLYKPAAFTRSSTPIKLKTPDALIILQISCSNGLPLDEKTIQNLKHFDNSLKLLPTNAQGHITVQDFLQAVEKNELTLLSVQKPLIGYNNQDLLDQIQSALRQKVRAICSSPKQGIRTDELVQDVNLVKRINSNTLTHLASHTEHWKARTLSGLVPKRLKADIIEDEVNIYENLFFKMAVDDISDYTTEQILSLKAAKQQNTNAIDWELYGAKVNDYRRSVLLQKLFTGRDSTELSRENKAFDDALEMWLQVSKILTSIRGSAFYRKIDSKKRISRTIHLTNILKNDQRYKALYDIWCLVQKEKQRQQHEQPGVKHDTIHLLEHYYANYAMVTLIYAMNLLDIKFRSDSFLMLHKDGPLTIQAIAEDDRFRYSLSTKQNDYQFVSLNLQLVEKVDVAIPIPPDISAYATDFSNIASVASYRSENHMLHFHKKPNSTERTALRDIIRKTQAEVRKMTLQEKYKYQNAYDTWNKLVVNLISDSRLHDPTVRNLQIFPLLFSIQPDANMIDYFTQELFDSCTDYSCYLLPHSLEDYRELKRTTSLRRLFNYGEAYHASDASHWKNYRVAILPTTQTDIGTIQRLMKFISLHCSILMMEMEDGHAIHCPVCGKKQIKQLSENAWKCEQADCGIEWGKTRCIKGCQEYFFWIRPDCEVAIADFQHLSEYQCILKKTPSLTVISLQILNLKNASMAFLRHTPFARNAEPDAFAKKPLILPSLIYGSINVFIILSRI